MPIVMPSESEAIASSSVITLLRVVVMVLVAIPSMSLGRVGVALVDERVAQLVADARQVELEREPLLEPVANA